MCVHVYLCTAVESGRSAKTTVMAFWSFTDNHQGKTILLIQKKKKKHTSEYLGSLAKPNGLICYSFHCAPFVLVKIKCLLDVAGFSGIPCTANSIKPCVLV